MLPSILIHVYVDGRRLRRHRLHTKREPIVLRCTKGLFEFSGWANIYKSDDPFGFNMQQIVNLHKLKSNSLPGQLVWYLCH